MKDFNKSKEIRGEKRSFDRSEFQKSIDLSLSSDQPQINLIPSRFELGLENVSLNQADPDYKGKHLSVGALEVQLYLMAFFYLYLIRQLIKIGNSKSWSG